ncbi:MAG: hypothetical protein JRD49_00040 [Deltaproteobacteria bacterium]|nr:hypothetical protein [Deltaproteobacteria bacterium]MBW2633968.1 hypothetical protein [Deltaproteobacteria bacterium]MBW2675928.1 hypothetical protein [Deltaproteobacteria bacterium]
MPFENTHLHLADKVRQKLQGDALAAALKEHLAYYYLGCRMVTTAHGYFTSAISRKACAAVITGKSLQTGRLGKTLQHIRYAASAR